MNGRESAHVRLRRATRAAHHALDHHPLLQRLVRTDLSLDEYAQSLRALHAPHAALEQRVLEARWCAGSGLNLRGRCHLLRRDLAALGMSPAEPVLDGFAPPDSVSEWLGQAYVLEGSRLGSAVIVCRVAGILGEQVPRRFLAATQEDYAWPRLLFVLEAKLDTPAKLQSAIEAACSAFAAYRCTLDVLQDC